MKVIIVAMGGILSFLVFFVVANNLTGMISRSLRLSQGLDNALLVGGIGLATIGAAIIMKALWRRNR